MHHTKALWEYVSEEKAVPHSRRRADHIRHESRLPQFPEFSRRHMATQVRPVKITPGLLQGRQWPLTASSLRHAQVQTKHAGDAQIPTALFRGEPNGCIRHGRKIRSQMTKWSRKGIMHKHDLHG